MKNIVALLFDNFEILDSFGPLEIFGRMKDDFQTGCYSLNGGFIKSFQNIEISTKSFTEINFTDYILLIPGGIGTRELINDKKYIDQLKKLSADAEYILTVCTGSVLFSKTGLLDNKNATTNKRVFFWAEKETAAVKWIKKARWVKDGNIYTSSGVSAGIDMTLGFIKDTLGYEKAKQQGNEIEYQWNEDPSLDPFSELY